jgi:hypothetical protein
MSELQSIAKEAGFEVTRHAAHDGITFEAVWRGPASKKSEPVRNVSGSSGRYDPEQAYRDRMTPAARSRESMIRGSQFGSTFGGDDSNYKPNFRYGR